MPIYTFQNKKTKKEIDLEMTWQECEVYQEENIKKMQRVYKAPGIGDSIRLGITKPPSDFTKYILGRVKESVPGAKKDKGMERRIQIPREF